ncbi:hypothetical protein WA026_003824 [Henosepilachna vigintioctopunctata]|uniref:GP-PDE domain-containing protein n=1 Tax=Henosepilachna vigintioctopunctata TaxID=420089 RepID=A0AAW1U8X6_9CUCU
MFIVICALTAVVSLTSSSWKRYSENPTVVSLEKDYRNWLNLFPAVTGCFMKKVDDERAEEYIKRKWKVDNSSERFNYYMDFITIVSNISYHNLKDFGRFKNDMTLNNIDLLELASYVHPKLLGTLVTFEPKKKPKWTIIMTEIGICFSVNTKFAPFLEINVREERRRYGKEEIPILRCHYLNGLCYARYDSDPSLPVKYYVHSFLDVVHATIDEPIVVEQSQEMDISFQMQETTSSPTLRQLSPAQRKCRFHDEPQTKEVPIYSTSICYMLCRRDLALALCGCNPFFYVIGESGKVCDIDGMICLSKYIGKLTSNPSDLHCNCPQPCNLLIYLRQVPKITKWEFGYFDQRLTFRWGLIPPTTKYIRDVIFGLENLVASSGGTVSLFLGMSMIGLVEFFYLIIESVVKGYILLKKVNSETTKKDMKKENFQKIKQKKNVSVPPPSQEAVDAILGKDLCNVDSGNTEYVVRTVAHRGAALDAPENTLAAFSMCKAKGCDFIEFDVCLTADGVPVVFHDDSTQRMADVDLVIKNHKWKDLKDLNLSVKHPFKDRYPQTNIPTLDQTVNQLLAAGQRMFIDIKDNDTKMVKVIVDVFEKYPDLESRAIVTSFFPNIIYLIRRKNPKIVCSVSWRPYSFVYESFNYVQGPGPRRAKTWHQNCYLYVLDSLHEWLLPRLTYYLLGISVLLIQKDALGPKTVLDWKNKGVRLMAWTVNSPIEKQFLAKILKITYLTDTLTGLLLVLCVVAAVYYFRVPPPSTEVVESIIGKDIPDVKSPDDKSILKVVAHRGAILDVPENTLEAYSYCKKKGCNFIEFDVCLTADGVPIVFHDFTTGRLCNQDLEILTTNWKDLKKLNLSDKHPHKDDFPETRIPTLEETVSQLLADGQKMFIDLKYRDPKLVKVVLDIFKKHPDLYNQAIVTSFFPSAIYQIRRQDPKIVGAVAWCPHAIYFASKVSYVGGPLWKKTMIHIFDEILAWLLPKFIFFLAGFSVILLHRYAMDVKTVWDWRRRGVRVMGWTLNKPIEKEYCITQLEMPYLTDTLKDDDNVPPTELDKHMKSHYTNQQK